MKFTNASAIEQVTWELRLADYERSKNRARINDLFNGTPPYTDEEVEENNIDTNVNFLEPTKIAHDARRQFYNAFLNPQPLFTVGIDYGPVHKRQEWGGRITKDINRTVKQSLNYHEVRRSTFAQTVLHGNGPVVWEDGDMWCPDSVGIEDVLVPANTLLTLKNLPFFAVYRQYTAMQLMKMTRGPKVDPAWNMPLVKEVLKWADEQATKVVGNAWPELWSPEKMSERWKQDTGLYISDAVPTIDCWDFYFWNEDSKVDGWNRRIVLDAWNSATPNIPKRDKFGGSKGQFLYNPKDRVYAANIGQIAHWQFADASCVAPFRYHSIRSLGFLLYSICQLQNRLRCKFNDAVFEALLQYFRVSSPDDMDRLQKISLSDKGIIPEGLNFVKNDERWQVNDKLVMQALQMNRQSMLDNSAAFTQDLDLNETRGEETATRTMAKVNATAALVGAMLNQAYNYQAFQYQEICRRFRKANSRDSSVVKTRNRLLKAGVPAAALNEDCWDVTPVRVIGSGNKLLQIAIADKLVAMRQFLNPAAQQEVDRMYISANSDDWDLADRLVPEQKEVSPVTIQAQVAIGTLLMGLPVTAKPDINHVDYVEAALNSLATKVGSVEQRGSMATADEIAGFKNAAQHIAEHIQFLAANPSESARVKQYSDDLVKIMNHVKAFEQQLQQAQEKAAKEQASAIDPATQAKVQGDIMLNKVKVESTKEAALQKEAIEKMSFQAEEARKQQAHEMDVARTMRENEIELSTKAQQAKMDIEIKQRENELKIQAKEAELEAKKKAAAVAEKSKATA